MYISDERLIAALYMILQKMDKLKEDKHDDLFISRMLKDVSKEIGAFQDFDFGDPFLKEECVRFISDIFVNKKIKYL